MSATTVEVKLYVLGRQYRVTLNIRMKILQPDLSVSGIQGQCK